MKRLFTIYFVLIVLFFFTGCAGVWEFFGDIADKLSEKKSEGTKGLIAPYYLEKASTYEKNDELQTALFYLQIAGTLNPDSTKIHENIASLKSAINHKAGQHFTAGVEFFKKRKIKDARKQFLTTLRYAPGHKDALDYLKNRLHPKEYQTYKVKDQETLKDISKKFYKDPSKEFLIAYFNNLKTCSKLVSGTILELPILGSEINRSQIHISTELARAETLLNEKRYPEVLGISEKILEYDPLNQKASDLKNSACFQIGLELSGQKNYPEAIGMFKKVSPDYQGVEKAMQQAINKQLLKAEALLKQKQYEEALAVAGKVLDEDRSNTAAKNLVNTTFCHQARNLLIRKDYTNALKVLTRADPEYDCVKKTISDVYTAKNKQAEVHYLKGVKHFLNEELQSAISEWEKALTLNPEHKKAKKNIDNARSLLEKLKKVK
jgi:tetratricopeptide (TPR) repeat protein